MQVRVFESKDMASGLQKIKKELGPDALILSTRTVRNGKLGVLGKPMLEITAAVDADYRAPEQTQQAQVRGFTRTNLQGERSIPPAYTNSSANSETFSILANRSNAQTKVNRVLDDEVDQYLDHGNHQDVKSPETIKKPTQSEETVEVPQSQTLETEVLKEKINELKLLVTGLSSQLKTIADTDLVKNRPQSQAKKLRINDLDHAGRLSKPILQGDHVLSTLIDRGINVETARTIAGFLRESLTEQELSDSARLDTILVETIENLIETNPPLFTNSQGPKNQDQQRIALVGPTGVGKTTTLAKICASYLSSCSGSVALITIDTYRIAAVEQLKIYGEIMNLPVDVVITPEQMEQALEKHSDKDLILIDTAGRSPRDTLRINELASFFPAKFNIDKHLVLSATTRETELLETLHHFSQLDINNTIITKIDECFNLGVLLNIQLQNPSPLSYLTNGQRVPEDLVISSPRAVAELIMFLNEGSLHD